MYCPMMNVRNLPVPVLEEQHILLMAVAPTGQNPPTVGPRLLVPAGQPTEIAKAILIFNDF